MLAVGRDLKDRKSEKIQIIVTFITIDSLSGSQC